MAADTPISPRRSGGRWISHWDPENETFWREQGSRTANRNLWSSIFAEHLGFSVWSLWSVLVLFMTPETGFSFSPEQKFLLVSVVAFVGAVLRIPYTLAVPRFGGRDWTLVSVVALLVPTVLAVLLIQRPETPYWLFLVLAATAGLGGGNFSSSMSNINFFFPERSKGWALGLNAGGGNIGVATVQLVGLAVIAVFTVGNGHFVPLVYLPLLLLAAWVAWRHMDNLAGARADVGAQLAAVKDRHAWIMSFLYIGTFGSFIGFGFAFGLLLQNQFDRTPMEAASVTFIGPALGSLVRPVGGWLSDRFGGGRITLWNFAAMVVGTGVIILAVGRDSLALFLAAFAVLFVLTGIGNGSTYKMIPAIYSARAEDMIAAGTPRARALAETKRLAGALLGLVGAVGALGGVGINLVFRESFAAAGSATPAFVAFLVFYAVCIAVTCLVYLRRPVSAAGRPAGQSSGVS
ncbi:NNP family nitrate/nitrite transporter-like MFS transporter [Spinactinospora alkalitolerans]|uniref:NNP family nitrate/nitrite transporter-like MFS transporter n=1 Tax=Spinactinospora alkalitolerans TaxID=687207 RepID=A0A852TUR4_9ACTN|nr:nitrate/nitrite transporter [Spinactinospora alkalitolerans]NYE47421.1 NNP family nitrate/nitrite transporter-like MFS transporter [Spinactinospora alkalitolerans]